MSESQYKVIELIGTSEVSWENAAENAVARAGENLQQLRIAEVVKMDMTLEDDKVVNYRTRVSLSFKYNKD